MGEAVGDVEAARRVGAAVLAGGGSLCLAGLGLSVLPDSVAALRGLTELDVSGNALVELPAWVGDLSDLEVLLLGGNRLVRLPGSLAGLDRLVRLDVSDNELIDLPVGLVGPGLVRLARLDVSGNAHLISPPPDVVASGSAAVLAYLRGGEPGAGVAGVEVPEMSGLESAGAEPGTPDRTLRAVAKPPRGDAPGPRVSSRLVAVAGGVVVLGVAVAGVAAGLVDAVPSGPVAVGPVRASHGLLPWAARSAVGAQGSVTPSAAGSLSSGGPLAADPAPPSQTPATSAAPAHSAAALSAPAAQATVAAAGAGGTQCATRATAEISADCYHASQRTVSETAASGDTSPAGVDGGQIARLTDGCWLEYGPVDFGAGSSQFDARVASGAAYGVSGLVEVVLDAPGNTPVGSFAVANTGGWSSWRTVPANMAPVTGTHTVYLEFASAATGDPPYVSLHYFDFPTS